MSLKLKVGVFAGLILLTLIISGLYSSHSRASQDKKRKAIEAVVQEKIPIGSSVDQVLTFLDQKHIEHSAYLSAERKVLAIIRNTSVNFLIVGDVQVIFVFDRNGLLVKYQVQDIYTGP